MKDKLKSLFAKAFIAIKAFFIKIHDKYRERFPVKEPKYYDGKLHEKLYIRKLAITAFIMYLYIETFARITDGVFEGVLFLVKHPLIFAYNWLIIFTTMCLALLFKRRGFALLIIGIFWGLLGTVNGVILLKRMTPFTLYDLQNAKDGFSLLSTYYSKIQITLGTAAIAIGLAMVVIYCINCYKWKNISFKRSISFIGILVVLIAGSTAALLKTGGLSTFFGNLNYAYSDYGFPYCFINTSLVKGISRPSDYSKEEITNILKKDTANGTDTKLKQTDDEEDYPNVIILQMESFTYAQDYHNIKVSNDPTPNFTKLMKNYSTGWFEVPACGAGTANTEFEVLTGISSKFFGPGEYPYKGKLREQTLESMAYVLRSHGYNTAALHNHRALFYNRNEVYANLGFNSFTSLEYMNNIKKTPTGWCKDEVLTDNIMGVMKSTDEHDFLHVVSVEGHGAYPTEQVFKDPYTTVTADNEETKWQYEYYVNECHEMDTFIGDLLKQIKKSGEPTVVLIYGDHIPALDVKESDYGNGDLYQTRYVIWDNIGLKKKDENLTSFEVGSKILSRIGLSHEGVIFDYEQTANKDSKDYLTNLKALSYDMIYGRNYTFGGSNPFKRVNMRMGYKDIKIKDIVKIGGSYYIRGENFTEHSTISLDGKVLKTIYLSPTLLGLQEKVDPDDVSKLQVSQIDTKDDTILSTIGGQEEL
jgi:phosphoglycerol transferase MdoB-like AlkP superfamily enzyme